MLGGKTRDLTSPLGFDLVVYIFEAMFNNSYSYSINLLIVDVLNLLYYFPTNPSYSILKTNVIDLKIQFHQNINKTVDYTFQSSSQNLTGDQIFIIFLGYLPVLP